jgi:hypothetical protein
MVAERLRQYERATDRFASLTVLLAAWGGEEHRPTLTRIASRLVENNEVAGGQTLWLGLRWYPAEIVLYAGGIAALSANNYRNLASLWLTPVAPANTGQQPSTLLNVVVDGMLEAARSDAFKVLPGHERHFVPRSEYLFKIVQPILEDLLYLGRTYESFFDRYEILAALSHADSQTQAGKRVWGPPGRFAWKASQGYHNDPYSQLLTEAAQLKDRWPPLQAGLFGGDYDRFVAVAEEYRKMIKQLGWF